MASRLQLLPAPWLSQQRRCGHYARTHLGATCSAVTTGTARVAPSIRNNSAVQLSDDGITCTTELRPKQTTLEIPASEWLTVRTVAASPLGPAVANLEPWLQLALYLIHTDSAEDNNSLPLLWNDDDRALLVGSQLAASIDGYAAYFAAKHTELVQGVYAAHPSLFPSDRFTEKALVQAACVVRASTHPPLEGDRIALVPGLQLAHSRRQAGSLSVKAGGLFGGEEKLVWEEGAGGWPAGQKLALDLSRGGDKVDSQMVLDYGARVFAGAQSAARDANPGYVLTLQIPETDAFADDKLDIASLSNQTGTFILTPSDPPPANCLAFLRLLNLSGADAFLLEALFRNEVWDHLQDPISEENERAVCEGLAAGCREALMGYCSSIDEDLALLRGGGESVVARAALLVRLGEKEAIDGALQWSEGRLEQLGRLEYYAERRLKRLGLLDDTGRTTYDSFFEDGIA